MKKNALLVGMVMLAGCAATPEPQTRSHSLDIDKVVAVETAARANNVRVIWINPPTVANRD
jgi:uncharacterized lipoprotein YmbA